MPPSCRGGPAPRVTRRRSGEPALSRERRPAMAAHLSSGRVNLTLLREAGRRELREFLDKCAGSKVSGSGGRGARRGPHDAAVPSRRPSCGTSTSPGPSG